MKNLKVLVNVFSFLGSHVALSLVVVDNLSNKEKLRAIKIDQWKSIVVPTNNYDVKVSSKFN